MAQKKTALFTYWYILYAFIIIILGIGLYMVSTGALNYKRIAVCKTAKDDVFCGIQEINLTVPSDINNQIQALVNSGAGKRVVFPKWKAGRTIATETITKELPDLFNWYKSLEGTIGNIIGEQVYITSDTLPTTCAVLVYENDGDFINWHYDVNYFDGRFFTLLIPCTFDNYCTEYTYIDKDNTHQGIPTKPNKSILFEGDKVFHMATPFCNNGTKRIIISVQFSTNSNISWYNRIMMRIKDTAYIGY